MLPMTHDCHGLCTISLMGLCLDVTVLYYNECWCNAREWNKLKNTCSIAVIFCEGFLIIFIILRCSLFSLWEFARSDRIIPFKLKVKLEKFSENRSLLFKISYFVKSRPKFNSFIAFMWYLWYISFNVSKTSFTKFLVFIRNLRSFKSFAV